MKRQEIFKNAKWICYGENADKGDFAFIRGHFNAKNIKKATKS